MTFMSLFVKKKPVMPNLPEVSVRPSSSVLANADEAVKQKRLSSRLALGAVNVGDLCMEGGLQVIGAHQGQLIITGETGVVWINETGLVTGDIDAPQVYIQGRVKGSVRAEMVIIEGSGSVDGQIMANRVLLRQVEDIAINARILSKETVVGQSTAAIVPINSSVSA